MWSCSSWCMEAACDGKLMARRHDSLTATAAVGGAEAWWFLGGEKCQAPQLGMQLGIKGPIWSGSLQSCPSTSPSSAQVDPSPFHLSPFFSSFLHVQLLSPLTVVLTCPNMKNCVPYRTNLQKILLDYEFVHLTKYCTCRIQFIARISLEWYQKVKKGCQKSCKYDSDHTPTLELLLVLK